MGRRSQNEGGLNVIRPLFAAAIAVMTLLLIVAAPAVAAERIMITPVEGHQDDTFTLTGSGLQPGLALDINFVSPDGQTFSTVFKDKVVVVGPDGKFTFEVLPRRDFSGASEGTWTVQVCVSGTDDCAEGEFDIEA